jgi:hypothetical protein
MLGSPSQTKQFKDNIDTYRAILLNYPTYRDAYSLDILFFPGIGGLRWMDINPIHTSFWTGGWGGYSELYASIVAEYETEEACPELLRGLFRWALIQVEMKSHS